MKYAIIIPAKNEEENLPGTLDSILNQTFRPEAALIVDDNSTDGTRALVEKYMKSYPFFKYTLKEGNSTYSLGGKVVEVFNHGLNHLNSEGCEYDYILKMDADITFEPDTFKHISDRLKAEEYGIVSCTPFTMDKGKKIFINSPEWHTNGDFKIYNIKCLHAIGGLKQDLGWDTADNIVAMERGWKTRVFRDVSYQQLRPIGRFSKRDGFVRQGLGAYKLRYSIFYMTIKVLHDMVKRPYFINGIYYLKGYFRASGKYPQRTLTKSQGKILRKLLWQSMFIRLKNRDFIIFQLIGKKN